MHDDRSAAAATDVLVPGAWLAVTRGRAEAAAASAERVATLSEDLPQQPIPRSVALSARAESYLWSGEAE